MDIFVSILDSIAPVKQVRLRQRTEEWMTGEILERICERDRLLHNSKKDKDQSL